MIKLERYVFFILLATIPIQLGKHFWPGFSFVHGIRLDYLSPTLYVSDIAFVLLFILSISRLVKDLLKLLFHPLFIITIVALIIGGDIALSPQASLFSILKFLEFSYVAFYVSRNYFLRNSDLFLFILTLGGIVQTIIATFQFIGQRSLGGVFYFLGERTFTLSTPGIAAFNEGTAFVLRPYGSFPHPNVLAFYLLFCFTFLLFSLKLEKRVISYLKIIALVVLTFGIFITFSRLIILLYVPILLLYFVKNKKNLRDLNLSQIVVVAVLCAMLIVIMASRFESGLLRDIFLRLELIKISLFVFLRSPIIGVGLNNFYFHEVDFQKNITPILLQPVHNIYLMWICQTGIVGAVLLFLFIKKLGKRLTSISPAILLMSTILVVGLFDHYPVTLQQGQLMASILIGMIFVKAPTE